MSQASPLIEWLRRVLPQVRQPVQDELASEGIEEVRDLLLCDKSDLRSLGFNMMETNRIIAAAEAAKGSAAVGGGWSPPPPALPPPGIGEVIIGADSQQDKPYPGDQIIVIKGFMSDSSDRVFLHAGLQGIVERVDEEGDLGVWTSMVINFDTLPEKQLLSWRRWEFIECIKQPGQTEGIYTLTSAFLSHNWGNDAKGRNNHNRVKIIAQQLKKVSIRSWLDEEKMSQSADIHKSMAKGIDRSNVFLCFVTKDYIIKASGESDKGEADNCYMEFAYGMNHNKRMIAVVMDQECTEKGTNAWNHPWGGKVGMKLGHSMYVDMTCDIESDEFREQITKLEDYIKINEGTSLFDLNRSSAFLSSQPSTPEHGLRKTPGTPKYVLFVGNPGAGKSTLLNCHAGKLLFKSGWSLGSGMTFQLDIKYHEEKGLHYMDTPGLSDVELRKAAAIAIREALQKSREFEGGLYKIIFVITLEHGRYRPCDLTTVKLVLEAAKSIESYYGIIINQILPEGMESMVNDHEDRHKFICTLLKAMPSGHVTGDIYFQRVIDKLHGKSDKVVQLPRKLRHWIDNVCPTCEINPKSVKIIDASSFESQREKIAAADKRLRAEIEDKEKLREELEGLKRNNENLRDQLDATLGCVGVEAAS